MLVTPKIYSTPILESAPALSSTNINPHKTFAKFFALYSIMFSSLIDGCNSILTIPSESREIQPYPSEYYEVQELISPIVDASSFSNDQKQASKPIFIPIGALKNCPESLSIQFRGFGCQYVIDLVKNKHLISDTYFRLIRDKFASNEQHLEHSNMRSHNQFKLNDSEIFLNLHNFNSNEDHCHYHGIVNGDSMSLSAITISDMKFLNGFMKVEDQVYELHVNSSNSSTILTRKIPRHTIEKTFNKCSHDPDSRLGTIESKLSRSKRDTNLKRDNNVIFEPFLSNSSSYYVELLVVHDHSQYLSYSKNTSLIAEKTMQIVNIMNAFYRQLNIFVALVGVVLWVDKDEIALSNDGDATLTNFLKYRYAKLLPKYPHDNAQLITSMSFNGSVVGKALKGPICTHEHSGGVNTAHSHNPAVVAVTLSHELGHNFGMEHDEDGKCECPDEKCIMSSSSSSTHPKYWSSCSVDYLEESKRRGLLDCLRKQPEKIFGPNCGNGFVEEGEDCDLGEPMPTRGTSKRKSNSSVCSDKRDCLSRIQVENKCCDRKTCKFSGNATCAQGTCCDLSTCSVFNITGSKVCRPRQSECDLEETCDGISEHCPKDVFYHDGIECGPTINLGNVESSSEFENYNRSRAYCFNGRCASHESQCKLLWGPTATVSKDMCFDLNRHGNLSGNCGYQRSEQGKLYDRCEPEDTLCGLLHCVHEQQSSVKIGNLSYGLESTSFVTAIFIADKDKMICNVAQIDSGFEIKDPGQVPNGAACGDSKMCLNNKCLPVTKLTSHNRCSSDCNGNGICDNMGVCHCHDGTIGTNCLSPYFHIQILLYTLVFLIPLVGLMMYIMRHYRRQINLWLYLRRKKIELKSRGRVNTQRPRLPIASVDRSRITISEPMPMCRAFNSTRPVYEPTKDLFEDPWAETSCQIGDKPPRNGSISTIGPTSVMLQQNESQHTDGNILTSDTSSKPHLWYLQANK